MAKIVRYNGNLVPFASSSLGTERTIFGEVTQADDITSQFTADFLRGWGIVGPSDQPTLQDFNAVSFTHGQILAYLHQMGIAEYNAAQEYHLGSLCNVSGQVYTSLINSNVGNTPASSPASWRSATQGRLIGAQVFAVSGVFTPNAETGSVVVEAVGGGGAGGGTATTGAGQYAAAYGGGGGAYAMGRFTSAFSGVTVTVGSAGVAAAGLAGTPGGASSFGALLVAPGGSGGTVGAAGTAGGVGVRDSYTSSPTGGNIRSARGVGGGAPSAFATPSVALGGQGADSFFGPGGRGRDGIRGTALEAGLNPGSGGGGGAVGPGAGATTVGGSGSLGLVIVWEYSR